ncbi:stage V sporulation protein D [Ornithinibacillus sp. 4-3]|uniref:serine-type D-Ala-D-Ala carboxypeptidase n=1 Tax=Ornithinibacillus sp. 4-3 TaxID=3231488 RepID=A0AB39HNV7_9BACI
MKFVSTMMTKKRIVTVFLFGILLFIVIALRLAYVQLVMTDRLTSEANDLWSRDISFAANRGDILDAQGKPIADSTAALSVMVVPSQIEDKETVAQAFMDILNMDYKQAIEFITKRESIVRVQPHGRKISTEQEEELKKLDLKGVYLAKDSKRHYPYDNYLSHVLGFTGIDNQGLMGLELFYDEKLSGKEGKLSYFSDAKGRRLEESADFYMAAEDGLHLRTTIDLRIQTILERELDIAESKYSPDGAIAIALNPNTGGILGMSSRPNFHPNDYQKVDSEVFNRNLPIWSTFEPGSTFKIITLAAALEEQVVDLENDRYFDTGSIDVGGTKLRCWKPGGHGDQSFLEVVQNSCNPGFVHLGQLLGKQKLFSYIEKFGFGSKTGIDLFGEGTGILFNLENVGPVELGTTSFGQGVSVTPIQQVMAVAAAINGGYLYEPYIAEAWIDPETGKAVEKMEPKLKEKVISDSTSEEIRHALETVVAEGTGRPAYVDDYRIGGKTGTAQKVGPDGRYLQNNYIVSFIGAAPIEKPEIVVYVAIDNPKNVVQFGGVVAAPIVGTIIEDSLRALDVPRSKDGVPKKYAWPEQPTIEVPDLIGMQTSELLSFMDDLTVETSGEGDYIIAQEPKAGIKVEEGSTIRVFLDEKAR